MRSAPAYDVEAATAEWVARVQDHSPDQVLMACPMAPPRHEVGGRGFRMAGELGGARVAGPLLGTLLGGFLARKTEDTANRSRAGGLPHTFVMAITPTMVRVFESNNTRKGVEVGAEFTAWERSGVQVLESKRTGPGKLKTDIRLRTPDGNELTVSAGTHDYTDRFVALLSTPPA
jgi:hypothetical protein